MAVAQVGALVSFSSGTVILSADMNQNFSDLRTAFNNLVTGANALNIDTISEVTSAGGVTVDGLLIKDGAIAETAITDGAVLARVASAETISGLYTFSHASGLLTDVIGERTGAAGVTVDGVLLKDAFISLGTNAAASGKIRLPNNELVVWRNAANTGDIQGWYVGADDKLAIGPTAGKVSITTASGEIGFFSNTGVTAGKQSVTGSRGGNAALTSLLTALAAYGLIADSSSA